MPEEATDLIIEGQERLRKEMAESKTILENGVEAGIATTEAVKKVEKAIGDIKPSLDKIAENLVREEKEKIPEDLQDVVVVHVKKGKDSKPEEVAEILKKDEAFKKEVEGKPGETPSDEKITGLIKPLIPAPIPGKNYELTEADRKEIASRIEPKIVEKVVEKTEIRVEVPIVKEVAMYETGDAIITKINAVEAQINAARIVGLFKPGQGPSSKSYGLGDLTDVSLTAAPTNGQALVFDSALGVWKPGTVASGGGTWGSITGTLADQTDLQTALNAKANIAGSLTQFVGNTAWRVFYSDANGDVTELALGASGTFLQSNGAAVAPSWGTAAGSGDVTKVGTPVNNQIGVWTGDGTLEGDANLTFDTVTNTLATSLITATTVTAALVGNASTATALATARTIGGVNFDGTANIVPATITVADTADATSFVALFESATGDLGPKTDLGLTYNATTGMLTATGLTGPLTGNVTGNLTGNVTGDLTGNVTGNVSGTAATVTSASQAAITTLANLVTIQGRTVTLADAGANAIFGWDDVAGAYENLSQAEARTVLGLGTAAYVATDLADLNEATIETAIDTLANLTSIQGLTVTLSDATFDVVAGWDDSAGAYKNFLLADLTTEASPASGDYILIYGAEGDLRKANWSTLPSGGATAWGSITGTLSSQTDLQTALDAKASTALSNLASVAINTTLVSDTDNTDALGTTAIAWSDLFLGSGAVIQFNSAPSTSDVTITHSANLLTLAGGDLALGANNLTMTGSIGATGARATKLWTADLESTNMPTVGGTALLTSLTAPQFTTIELGHATDTTLSRVSAGVIAIEGVNIETTATTANSKIAAVGITIDGGGSAITTGIKGDIMIPYACTINSVTLLADQTGSIVIDIWKDTYANYPATDADSITASAVPTITTATKSQDATLTGWTTSITAGDTIRFNVDSATTITRCTLVLKVTKT